MNKFEISELNDITANESAWFWVGVGVGVGIAIIAC